MVDKSQIKKWLNEGTINPEQAKKMLNDSKEIKSEEKSNSFVAIISTIGAVLIFIGFAWLIARNWHVIPSLIKVMILVCATLASFISGVFLRQNKHEGVGRSLITLGALLFILSLFLISQIYHLASTMQHYSWLLLLAWIIIMITAYLLDSPENLVVSMLTFFPWVILQYLSSITVNSYSQFGGPIFSFILIFLSSGALLFGLSALHNSLKHKFTNIYRFWTVFYFLLIFYILSFQSILPILSQYSFEGGAFSIFLAIFFAICFIGFILGAIFSSSKNPANLKEILVFIGILAILFILILSTKAGADIMGYCSTKTCYDFKNQAECNSAPTQLLCGWSNRDTTSREGCIPLSCSNYNLDVECNSAPTQLLCSWSNTSYSPRLSCRNVKCYEFRSEEGCNSSLKILNCSWTNSYCQSNTKIPISLDYKLCSGFANDKKGCVRESSCNWTPSFRFSLSQNLPTIFWLLWIVNNIIFIGFIILVLWYGQRIGSTKIINLALGVFILDIISRYIGFWFDFKGYLAFSILAIFGGLLLIIGSWQIPKFRKKLLESTKQQDGENQ